MRWHGNSRDYREILREIEVALPGIPPEEGKVPLFPAGTPNDALSTPPRKYIFLIDTDYTMQGNLAVKFVKETLKPKNPKLAIIYLEDQSGQQWVNGIKAAAPKFGFKAEDVLEFYFNIFRRKEKN